MKVLLLSAVLGLLYAGHGEAQLLLKPFSGKWKTHYIAASNKDKITEGGPFHVYIRHVEFHANNTVDIDFYVKSDGECVKKQVTGVKQKFFVYQVECKRDRISYLDNWKFKKETEDRGIPEENIVNFSDNDDCPQE
ncbi:odorant-binding protein-like isoform X3 [Bubalus kerabau]|uniref:odorant-binding protein-like isoform X3 n=1 Tax=Bubalus carabanensis TaxID=3119969 RepID=UPI00244ED699|nr:odorant-binding protein-like isoform X3 [Bubalus carabanensis]